MIKQLEKKISEDEALQQQLKNGFKNADEAIHQILRAAGDVGQGHFVRGEADVFVERGEDFAEIHRAVGRLAAEAVGGTDDLTGLHATAGEHGARDARPVVAPRVFIDDRRAGRTRHAGPQNDTLQNLKNAPTVARVNRIYEDKPGEGV